MRMIIMILAAVFGFACSCSHPASKPFKQATPNATTRRASAENSADATVSSAEAEQRLLAWLSGQRSLPGGDPRVIRDLHGKVRKLNLSLLTLDAEVIKLVAKIPSLVDIRLDSLPGPLPQLDPLRHLEQLSELSLGEVTLPPNALSWCANCGALHRVGLYHATGVAANIEAISRIPNLRSLNLAYTDFSGKQLRILSGNTTLSWLDISGTDITDEDLDLFQTMPGLRVLRLDETPTTVDGLFRLRRYNRAIDVYANDKT